METILWAGALIGAVLGLAHGAYVYTSMAAAGRFVLPDGAAMADDVEEMKAWKRSFMPMSDARSARLIVHMQHYHDELLTDFGADPLRKTGVLGPLKELIWPYEPRGLRRHRLRR